MVASQEVALGFGHHEDRTPTHRYEPTREGAMAAHVEAPRPREKIGSRVGKRTFAADIVVTLEALGWKETSPT